MKRIFSLVILLLVCGMGIAQTQQGIVKTRGRMVNGQVVAGQRLNGATITLNIGNPLVSGQNGAFSFNVPSGKNYSLVSAKKQGYTLADPEYTRRSFAYSATNPFYVVLEDEAQRQADINAATKKVRRTLTAQLQKREDEIEELKAQNKLTEQEYQQRLQELYDNQSKSEQLVKEMAERYASTDYDQLNEFNRQVQQYIEDGELQKADSMIRSKGNVEQRVAEYHQVVAANKKVREELEQSEAGAAKTYEDLAQDLYYRHEIFMQEHKQDSALYCLKMRADLDTTNMDAVEKYADLCYNQKKFSDCEKYYHICLRAYQLRNDVPSIAYIQNKLGNLYNDLHDYANSEKYLKLALEICEQLLKDNPDAYRKYLASTQNNLGSLYLDIQDYANCDKYYQLALENYMLLFKDNRDEYRADMAMILNNLAVQNSPIYDDISSEDLYKLALAFYEQLFKDNPDEYRADMAMIQRNLGEMYRYDHDHASSEKYLNLALENYEQLFKDNPDAYRADLANTYRSIMLLYGGVGGMDDMEKYEPALVRALELYRELYVSQPTIYLSDVVELQSRTIQFLFVNNRIDEAIAVTTYATGEANKEAKYSLARCYGEIADQYYKAEEYEISLKYIDKAIDLVPTDSKFYEAKGFIFVAQDKFKEAFKIMDKILEVNPDYMKENPYGMKLSTVLENYQNLK